MSLTVILQVSLFIVSLCPWISIASLINLTFLLFSLPKTLVFFTVQDYLGAYDLYELSDQTCKVPAWDRICKVYGVKPVLKMAPAVVPKYHSKRQFMAFTGKSGKRAPEWQRITEQSLQNLCKKNSPTELNKSFKHPPSWNRL